MRMQRRALHSRARPKTCAKQSVKEKSVSLKSRVLAIARVSKMQRALRMLHILQKHAHFRLFEPHVHPASKSSLVKQSIDLVDRDPDS